MYVKIDFYFFLSYDGFTIQYRLPILHEWQGHRVTHLVWGCYSSKACGYSTYHIGLYIHRSQGGKCMVMLEDQGVPKVSARLRWSQGVLNFQNSPNPRVVLLSIKINTIFHERRWISNGHCINRGYTGKKTIKMHFRNGMPHVCRYFVFWNALLHFTPCKSTSKSRRFLWVKGHYPHAIKDTVLDLPRNFSASVEAL